MSCLSHFSHFGHTCHVFQTCCFCHICHFRHVCHCLSQLSCSVRHLLYCDTFHIFSHFSCLVVLVIFGDILSQFSHIATLVTFFTLGRFCHSWHILSHMEHFVTLVMFWLNMINRKKWDLQLTHHRWDSSTFTCVCLLFSGPVYCWLNCLKSLLLADISFLYIMETFLGCLQTSLK